MRRRRICYGHADAMGAGATANAGPDAIDQSLDRATCLNLADTALRLAREAGLSTPTSASASTSRKAPSPARACFAARVTGSIAASACAY